MNPFSTVYVHLPVAHLGKRLSRFIDQGWNPELALQTRDLDDGIDSRQLGRTLANANLNNCIHAPFFDLNPASGDPDIIRLTAKRFHQTLDFAADTGATHIVFHPGYDPWRYARTPEAWLENSLQFWPDLLKRASGLEIQLCLENIFDTDPLPLLDLLQQVDSAYLRHCFDIGHWFLFSDTPIGEWLRLFKPYLSHFHLHDNRGKKDDHLPIGKGKIDFIDFFQHLDRLLLSTTATLEAHNQKDAERSIARLSRLRK